MYPLKSVAAACSVVAVTLMGGVSPVAAVSVLPASAADTATPLASDGNAASRPNLKPTPHPVRPTSSVGSGGATAEAKQAAVKPAAPGSAAQPAASTLDANAEIGAAALSASMAPRVSGTTARSLNAPMPHGPLSLNNAVLLAVSRHPSISSQIATLAQARGNIEIAKAGYYPQITVGTGSGNSSSVGTGHSVSLQIAQMLYDFGKISSTVDQAEATVRREQANLLGQLSAVEQKTAESFINVHRYQEQVRIAAQEVEATQQIYEMAKLRAQSGVSTRADPIQAETRLQSAQATYIAVKAFSDEMRQHLRTLVGGPVDNGVTLPFSDNQTAAMALDAAPNTDLIPGVLTAQAQELVVRSQLDNAKAQMWPTLSLNYANTKNITGKNAATLKERDSNHSFTMGLQWTAYQGGALAGQIRAAQYALEAARANVASARLAGGDAARGYREQALGASSRLSKLAERTASIAATRDLYREQYKLGSRSILDLLNAEQEYYQAALDEETVKHDYWIALINYIGALGTGNTFYGIASRSIQGIKVQ